MTSRSVKVAGYSKRPVILNLFQDLKAVVDAKQVRDAETSSAGQSALKKIKLYLAKSDVLTIDHRS